MRERRALLCVLMLSTLTLAAPGGDSAPTIDALLAGERVRIPLALLAERVALAASQDFRVLVRGGATPPTRTAVASAIEKAGSGWKLVDVIWVGAAS